MTGLAPRTQKLAQGVAVVGGIGGALPGRRQLRDEARGCAHVVELAWRHRDGDRPAERVADRVDLGRAPSA